MSEISQVDCGYLAIVQAMADEIWADSIENTDHRTYAAAAQAVLANQNVRFNELQGAKTKQVSLEWADNCDMTDEACGDDCEISGTNITPVCKTYELDLCRQVPFSVPMKAYRLKTIDQQEAIAKNMVDAMKILDEYIAKQVILGLHANAGTNLFTGGQGVVSGSTTCIPAHYWDATLFGYFAQVSMLNKFSSPYMITGNNLYQAIWQAQMAQANADGKGKAAMVGSIPVYQDPFNVEANAPGSTFLLHKNAAAFVSKAYYPRGAANAISKAGAWLLWSEPSRGLPGIVYDIVYNSACAANEFTDNYAVQLNGGFFVNPTGCTATNTGILEFECCTGSEN